MAEKVFKALLFMKRRPGMTVDEFRDYYENTHRVLAEKYKTPGLKRYVRRYLNPTIDEELPFDVVTELWFEDAKMRDIIVKAMLDENLPPEVIEDEKRVFDRPKQRIATVDEFESDCS